MEMNQLEIQLINNAGISVLKKKLTGLPLKDASVIARSIEWYNDPEPCMIHRSAVMKAVYMEFFEYFEGLIRQNIRLQPWRDVPDRLKEMLETNEQIAFIKLCI